MPRYKGSIVTIYRTSDPEDGPYSCEVRIDPGVIVVSYKDEGGHVVYKGREDGEGHYRLTCPERKGKATLHRFPDGGDLLLGRWTEVGEEGLWEIRIEPEDEDE